MDNNHDNHHSIGGIYTDPFHSKTTASANVFGVTAPWLGGLRFIASSNDTKFTTIGCDDGVHFWTLTGEFIDNNASMDFGPKAPGVGVLPCRYRTPGALEFLESDGSVGNTWSRLLPPHEPLLDVATQHTAFNNVNGLFVNTSLYTNDGSFAGVRAISDRLGKYIRYEICIVGTDNGKDWWCWEGGKWEGDKVHGTFSFATDDRLGTIHNGTIVWQNGDKWTKMVPTIDMHSLQKETSSL